jgi:hypothetical protein
MKVETIVKHFVLFIILIKIGYSISYFTHIILDNYSGFSGFIFGSDFNSNFGSDFNVKILYWKEVTEFIFIVCMSILLIYHFFPDHNFIHNYKPIVVDFVPIIRIYTIIFCKMDHLV